VGTYVMVGVPLAENALGTSPSSLVREKQPLQAFSATLLVFHGVFSERFCVLALRSHVCD